MQRGIARRRPCGDLAGDCRVDGAHRVDGATDSGAGRRSASRRPDPTQACGVAVAESELRADGAAYPVASEPAVEVQRVEERDADAGVARRGEQRFAHGVRVVVRRAVGLVVDVVELADAT